MEAAAGDAANGIANIGVVGSQMTAYLQDGTALGPYTLPTAMIRYRGDWTAATAYNELDPGRRGLPRPGGSGFVNAQAAWGDIGNVPAAFAPSPHTHPWSEITGQPALVDALPATVGTNGQVLKAQAGAVVWGTDDTGGGSARSRTSAPRYSRRPPT